MVCFSVCVCTGVCVELGKEEGDDGENENVPGGA